MDSARVPIAYDRALAIQRDLVVRRATGQVPDILWLLEHPPTVTWGSAGGEEHLLLREAEYERRGIALRPTERGGDVTFHEPGQLVGYPIIQLQGEERDLHRYLRGVEDALISVLAGLDIDATRIAGRTGVWLTTEPARKIAAIGVRAKRWVTSHGFALNVENDLQGFETIVPCGIADAAVTSLKHELGAEKLPSWEEVCGRVHGALERTLERPLMLVRGVEL